MVKKLLYKIILLLLLVQLPLYFYIEYFPMYFNSKNNTRWVYLKEKLKEKRPQVDVLFLGESRVNAGIDINRIANSWSFAAGGTTAIEMYYMLSNYLKINKKPKIIYFSLAPRSLVSIYSFWDYAVRNNFFSVKEMNEILEASYQLEKHQTIGYLAHLKYEAYRFNFIKYYQFDIKKSKLLTAYKRNMQLFAEMDSMRGRRFHPRLKAVCHKPNCESKLKNFKVPALLNHYLYRLFDLCQQNNIPVIFDFSPMNETSVKQLKPQVVSSYKLYINKLAKKYPDFLISDTLYAYPDSCFGDPSHLNKRGQEKFTNYLIEKYFQ